MTKNNENLWSKIGFIALAMLSIIAYYYLTKYLNVLALKLFLGILKIPMQQFIKFMYLSDILIDLIQLIIFFVIYKLLVKRNVLKGFLGKGKVYRYAIIWRISESRMRYPVFMGLN